jgi:histidine triad (HIT) family protein
LSASDGCLFCAIVRGDAPASVVHEDAECVSFLDIFPMRPGHVLIVPRRHAVFVHELTAAERAALMEAAARIAVAQADAGLQREGGTLLVNDGPGGGQHVPHVHLHVVPRRRGDLLAIVRTYAARILTGRRPVPQPALDALAERIRARLSPSEVSE